MFGVTPRSLSVWLVAILLLGAAVAIPANTSPAAWDSLAPNAALEAEHFSSLEQAAASADLIVVAMASETRLTRTVGSGPETIQFAELDLSVSRYIKGSFRSSEPEVISMEYLVGALGTKPEVEWPGQRALFLLRQKRGSPTSEMFPAPIDESRLYRLVSSQGLSVDNQGVALVPLTDPGKYKASVESMTFEDAVQLAAKS